MRGMGHCDLIESAIFRHEEGNEGEKNGVKRGFRAFYGAKLLKKKDSFLGLLIASTGERNKFMGSANPLPNHLQQRRKLSTYPA